MPPDHPHEAARQKGRRRGHAGGTRRIRRGPDLPHRAIPTSACSTSSAAATSTPSSSATTTARRRRATRPSSSARAASASRWWPPTASAYATPPSASCSTSSPASATSHARRRPAACWRATPSATSSRPRKWRACSPTFPKPSPTRASSPRAWNSPSPISATSFRATRCPRAKRMNSFLRKRADEGARRRYQPVSRARPPADRARAGAHREAGPAPATSSSSGTSCASAGSNGILAQGRGSAANSAVCYALGITAVDPVGMDLLFERFLSEERGEWPDIDLDLPSGDQRERVIQYVYQRYGQLRRGHDRQRHHLPRPLRRARGGQGAGLRRALRSNGSPAWSRTWEWKDPKDTTERQFRDAGLDLDHPRVRKFLELYRMAQDLPRHLGQHSGGMVICQGQLDSVVPLEPATMPGRVVVQWDKEDCADMGIIKVDLLGLGMMAVLEDCLELIPRGLRRRGRPGAPAAGRSGGLRGLQKADTVGMFQVESRAQMACAAAHEAARASTTSWCRWPSSGPGRSSGKMVHPYLNRRQGREAAGLPASLARTGAAAHPRRAAVPGAVAAHGHDRRRIHRRRGRGAAPRHGLQALGKAHGGNRSEAARRHGRATASPARRRTISCAPSPRSRSTASPNRTPPASRCSPTPART